MTYQLVSIDSAVLGATVLSLDAITASNDFEAIEAEYVAQHRPAYVSSRVALEDVVLILKLQDCGFRFIETQLKATMEPQRSFDTSAYPYTYSRVETPEDLDAVLQVAAAGIRHDRFSIDPDMPRWYSAARYAAYLRQSFESDNEEIWQLRSNLSHKPVAFRSVRRMADDTVVLLLDAVSPAVPTLGVGMIATQFFLSEMFQRGIRSLVTHASVIHLPEFAVEFTGFGFRLIKAYAVLRKIYKPLADRVAPCIRC